MMVVISGCATLYHGICKEYVDSSLAISSHDICNDGIYKCSEDLVPGQLPRQWLEQYHLTMLGFCIHIKPRSMKPCQKVASAHHTMPSTCSSSPHNALHLLQLTTQCLHLLQLTTQCLHLLASSLFYSFLLYAATESTQLATTPIVPSSYNIGVWGSTPCIGLPFF